ncbi:MAG TPA: hypothetical protein VK789_11260 [Bryobacteraceae bacterium]|nr:hypothetical protein [Bryobacteraceae bacterium]
MALLLLREIPGRSLFTRNALILVSASVRLALRIENPARLVNDFLRPGVRPRCFLAPEPLLSVSGSVCDPGLPLLINGPFKFVRVGRRTEIFVVPWFIGKDVRIVFRVRFSPLEFDNLRLGTGFFDYTEELDGPPLGHLH